MNLISDHLSMNLPRRQSMSLAATPVRILCRSGRLWITDAGGRDDIILEAGQSHVSSRAGTLIQALREARFELHTPVAPPALAARIAALFRQAIGFNAASGYRAATPAP